MFAPNGFRLASVQLDPAVPVEAWNGERKLREPPAAGVTFTVVVLLPKHIGSPPGTPSISHMRTVTLVFPAVAGTVSEMLLAVPAKLVLLVPLLTSPIFA